MPTSTAAPPADPQTETVRHLAKRVRDLTSDRDVAIVRAHAGGAPTAALARAADLDVGTVRRILARTR